MGRRPDPRRREEILGAVALYLEQKGLAGLSLRPLAAAVGVSPRTLLYHFGSKERLLAEALDASPALREAVAAFARSEAPLFDRIRRLWEQTAAPGARPYLRLFFEVYAAAVREPDRYRPFLERVVDRWVELLTPMLRAEGVEPSLATTVATELLALHHGAALDLLATGDASRVGAAYLRRVSEVETGVREARRH